MAQPALNPKQLRFGLYELDLESRELRKSGIRIKLQEQPFLILSMLLQRPGEIVTREDLQKRLWPADTFVDFDLSLNSAVKKLRQALNDDSDNPRFIETLYRRGYRFIGPVNGSQTAEANGNGAAHLGDSDGTRPAAHLAVMPAPPQPRRKLLLPIVAITLAVVAAAVWFYWPQPIRVLGYRQITHDARAKGRIVTDGERLYFSELDNDHYVLAQVSTRGGETSLLQTPFANLALGGISPDDSSLLVSDSKGVAATESLWSLPLPAGSPRRLMGPRTDSAAWSPDGKELVYSRSSEIFIAQADATNPRRIATADGMVNDLVFSPDGERLRFFVSDPSNALNQMWEMKRDGSGMHKMLPDYQVSQYACCGHWTRDGRYFIFASQPGTANNVWALPEKRHWFSYTPEPVQLTNGPLDFLLPIPSKDGKQIFMVGSKPRAQLLRFQPGQGFVPQLQELSAIDFSYSPDGQWMAYVTVPDFMLWRSRIDGSSPMQLTTSSLYAELPRWSPDGKQIVFMGRTEPSNFRAFVVSPNASDLHELIPDAKVGFDPGWSPDGKSIVLSMSDNAFPGGGGISIFDLASQKLSELPDSRNYFSPRWSPDGKYIVAVTKDSSKLVIFDVASKTWSDLLQQPLGTVGYPSWSRDGQYLYFDNVFTDNPQFLRMRISDHKLETISSLRGFRRFQGNFGSWAGLGPDDSPQIVSDVSSQEIYALDWETP